MITLGGMVAFMILSGLIGKHTRRVGILSFLIIAFIALIQVALIIYDISIMQVPHPPQ